MQPSDFDFALPPHLIAQRPLEARAASRLLHVRPDLDDSPEQVAGSKAFADLRFNQLADLLAPGDLLVMNDTKVLPARLFGRKASGGKLEMLLERLIDERRVLAQLKASRAPLPGAQIDFDGSASATVTGRDDAFFELEFDCPVMPLLEAHGHMPLPPYIDRPDEIADRERYQTVFARQPGAVAAPTAGLHFDRAQINQIRSRGINIAYVTLHVGAGTFQPLRKAQWISGELHSERVSVSPDVCRAIDRTRTIGGRVIAIGTTSVRALETAARGGSVQPFEGDTTLFIRPGYKFNVVDCLLTNFHLPESSLLMLVCAFAGTGRILSAYAHAVSAEYRFFSYGDAMFCHRHDSAGPGQ